MKKNTVKFILITISIVVTLLGGAIYYASTKLQPEEIRKIAIEQTSIFFPNSEVILEKIDVKIGFNFKIHLSKFVINYDGKVGGAKAKLAAINELQIKIPFWAILMGGGVVEFRLDKPEINFEEYSNGTNWTLAAGKSIVADSKSQEVNNNKNDKISLGPLAKSKINIRFNETKFTYKLKTKATGQITISKLVVNGLNFESPSAFELASNISTTDSLKNTTSFDVLAIGQIHLNDFIQSGNIPVDSVIKINQFTKTGMNLKFPELSTNINLIAKKDGVIEGKFETTFESQNKVMGSYIVGKTIKLSDFSAEIYMKDLHTILALDNSLDMSKAKFRVNGSFEIDEFSKMSPNFQYELSPAISTTVEGVSIATTSKGEFKDDQFSLMVSNKIMEGTATVNILGKIDINKKIDIKSLDPIDVKIVARDIKLTEKFIRSKLWPAKKSEEVSEEIIAKESIDTKKAAANETQTPTLPPIVALIDWANINIGGSDFQGKGKIITSSNSIAIDGIVFKFAKGAGKLSQVTMLKKNTNETKFNFEVTNLNLDSFKPFLPPFVENFKGDFTGKVSGNAIMFKTATVPKFDIETNLNVKQGEIKKLNISDYINPVMKGLPVVKNFYSSDKELKIDGNFETLSLKGNFTDAVYKINQFNFLGLGKKVEINGSGTISPNPNNTSEMEVNVTDNTGKISDVLHKNTGSKTLPIKLVGAGFTLKPDVNFTIGKLAKGALKTKGEEKLKEVTGKVIEKAADKLLKGKMNEVIKSDETKEKVNKLLKGLFK